MTRKIDSDDFSHPSQGLFSTLFKFLLALIMLAGCGYFFYTSISELGDITDGVKNISAVRELKTPAKY